AHDGAAALREVRVGRAACVECAAEVDIDDAAKAVCAEGLGAGEEVAGRAVDEDVEARSYGRGGGGLPLERGEVANVARVHRRRAASCSDLRRHRLELRRGTPHEREPGAVLGEEPSDPRADT